jgi:hypothetical protein
MIIEPGSTIEGEYGRAMGVYSWGLGLYNYHTAVAYSIWLDALARENAMIELAHREAAARYHARITNQRIANSTAQARRAQRVVDEPTGADVTHGASLNALLREIAKIAAVSPSALRLAPVSLTGGAVEKAPLFLAREGAVVSVARLLPPRKSWPLNLRAGHGDRAAGAYEVAIDRALDAVSNGRLSDEQVRDVERSLESLKGILAQQGAGETAEASAFVHELERSAQSLSRARAENVLRGMLSYGGTTVGDLVKFMTRLQLQFGPAETAAERELYVALHPLFAEQYGKLKGQTKNGGSVR